MFTLKRVKKKEKDKGGSDRTASYTHREFSALDPDGEDEMAEPRKDLGENDANFIATGSNTAPGGGGRHLAKPSSYRRDVCRAVQEWRRTPVLRRPSDYVMEYEDVFFSSLDGIPLEAWFIPANSDKLVIINHPMTCNRYGFPGHLPPWTMFGGFEVNFLPELKHLHDAGYNILTYKFRNCGMSGEANGNTSGLGLLKCRDVVGSIRYAKSRKDLASMTTGLFSRCMGATRPLSQRLNGPRSSRTFRRWSCSMWFPAEPSSSVRGERRPYPEKAASRLDGDFGN